jgi:hypothetical protein
VDFGKDGWILIQHQQTKKDPTIKTQLRDMNSKTHTKEGFLEVHDADVPLPVGWEQLVAPCGRLYFQDHNSRTTTFTDPRTGMPSAPVIKEREYQITNRKRVSSLAVDVLNDFERQSKRQQMTSPVAQTEHAFSSVSPTASPFSRPGLVASPIRVDLPVLKLGDHPQSNHVSGAVSPQVRNNLADRSRVLSCDLRKLQETKETKPLFEKTGNSCSKLKSALPIYSSTSEEESQGGFRRVLRSNSDQWNLIGIVTHVEGKPADWELFDDGQEYAHEQLQKPKIAPSSAAAAIFAYLGSTAV